MSKSDLVLIIKKMFLKLFRVRFFVKIWLELFSFYGKLIRTKYRFLHKTWTLEFKNPTKLFRGTPCSLSSKIDFIIWVKSYNQQQFINLMHLNSPHVTCIIIFSIWLRGRKKIYTRGLVMHDSWVILFSPLKCIK